MLLDKNILEYQKIDMSVYSLEKEFRKSDQVRALKIIHKKYRENKEILDQLTKEASDLMATFQKSSQKINEIEEFDKEIDEEVSQINDLSELDLYNKSLIKYEEFVSSIDKEINRIIKRLMDIKADAQKLMDIIKDLGGKYISQKKVHDEKQEEVKKKATPFLIQLKSMQEKIDASLIKKYYELRSAKKMPAFVEYVDGNCAGCGMEISIEVDSKLLNSGDYAECPECRRIVYKP